MVEITLPILLQIVQTMGILVGIIYYITIMRNQQKNQRLQLETRQTQLFMHIYATWSEKEFQKDLEQMRMIWAFDGFDDFFDKYGFESNPDEHVKYDQVNVWLEGIGALVRRGLIDINLICDMESFAHAVIVLWERFGPVIVEFRERFSLPYHLKDYEYLYNAIRPIWLEHNPARARGRPGVLLQVMPTDLDNMDEENNTNDNTEPEN